MADPTTAPPLTPSSIATAHTKIKQYIHRTPLLICSILDTIASSSEPRAYLSDDPPTDLVDATTSTSTSTNNGGENKDRPAPPRFRLFFKCENYQKIGAFKARGAFHALSRLIEELGIAEVRRRGVVTHSSGNHAQALALASSVFDVPSYIVMPGISTPSKIAGTKLYTRNVIFSGSTSTEREEVVQKVMRDTGAVLIPPYDHPDIILGQGTLGKEMVEQFVSGCCGRAGRGKDKGGFDAVIAPIGGGGLLAGIATWFADKPSTKVFGAEPSYQECDDARRGLALGKRIEHVKSLTIADGLRTPVGLVNWEVVSDRGKVEGVYAVTEEQIKWAMRLVFERMKVVVEPSGCVPLAVVFFNAEFREMVAREQQKQKVEQGDDDGDVAVCWDVGVVFSGGNTTMAAIAALFGDKERKGAAENGEENRAAAQVGVDGEKRAEDVAG